MSRDSPRYRDRTYAEIVDDLKALSVPIRELHGAGAAGRGADHGGHVAVTLAAGRIAALAFARDSANLLWSNPALQSAASLQSVETLSGGVGGDRLWFDPELRYHWRGEPDWAGLSNYHVPVATDPGNYRYLEVPADRIAVASEVRLSTGSMPPVSFSIRREVRLTDCPIDAGDPLLDDVQFVGVESTHHVRVHPDSHSGEVGLWHLLQVPVGAVMVVPLRAEQKCAPLSYGLPGDWQLQSQSLIWRIRGVGNAKIGLPAAALTGRAGVVRKLESGLWCLIVRQFPAEPGACYADHPYGIPRRDQVVQVWDGGGFGELEYHSPALVVERGGREPVVERGDREVVEERGVRKRVVERNGRELDEQDQIWAFGAGAARIAAIAEHLLGVDIRPLLSP